MFQVGLLLIIRRYYSVYTAVGICHVIMLTGCWQDQIQSCQQPAGSYYMDISQCMVNKTLKKGAEYHSFSDSRLLYLVFTLAY